jgi:hypothetical protein
MSNLGHATAALAGPRPADDTSRGPALLVSVRNPDEADTAIRGGADWIDVKEPSRGPLGAADSAMVAAVVDRVAGGLPVSAAGGELLERPHDRASVDAARPGVRFVKFGLAGCVDRADWPQLWRTAQAQARPTELIAVVYADWQRARAPVPADVLRLAREAGSPALLVDTYDKSAGSLFDAWPAAELADWVRTVRNAGVPLALAGSLRGPLVGQAALLAPDWIAVRGAACSAGRCGTINGSRVAAVRAAIERVITANA